LCDMKAHAAMHIGMREFPCNRCTYSTKRAHVLEAHLQMHAEEDGLPASSQQGSSDVDAKKRISIRWRGKVIGTRSGSKLTRVYACNFCPFRTRFCAPLFTHSRNHTGHRAMRCTRCTFTTSVSRKLREHCALHPLARSTVSSLSRNTHPDGFFTCRDCPFSCDSYGKLWHHVQKHKRASRFSCDLCTFSTGSSSCLAEHRALHSCSLQSESKMEEIIVVSDSSSVKEYEGFDETDEMEVDEQTSSVDHSMEHETSRAEPVSNTTSLSSSDGGRRQAVEKEEHDDMPVKDSSPSLVNNDEEDPFVSNEMELLMRIRKTHSNLLVPSEKSYRCSECPFISEDKMVLAFHSDRHRAKGGHLKCNMCSYKAHTPEALCSHINLHTKAHPQAAAVASFRKRKPRRSSPESISQNGKLIKCTRCAYQTASADRYTAHCLEHALRIQRRLETSIRRSKSSGGGIEKKQKGYRLARKIDGQQFCWKCSFHCDSESALGTHMELHGLAAPFVCSLCDYGSFSKNVVLFHEMNHHLDVPLTNFCNNSFAAVDQPKSLVLLESSELQSRQQSLRCNRCGSILHNFTEFVTHCNLIHHDNTPNSNLPADDRMEDEVKNVKEDSGLINGSS
uniref:C2H2-type domain-containing protein n=1 Tax=Toxocara canis TaxID=6265 RepID=A0A183V264_TOXCA